MAQGQNHGSTRPTALTIALLLPVALIAMVVITSCERELVTTEEGLTRVGYGFPFDWAIQDQSIQAAPPPYELSPAWLSVDVSVSIRWLAFTVDLMLTFAILVALLWIAQSVRRRTGRGTCWHGMHRRIRFDRQVENRSQHDERTNR